MTIKHYRVIRYWSGHSTHGGSAGKEWAGILAQLVDGEEAETAPPGGGEHESHSWIYRAVFGATGQTYQGRKGEPKLTTKADAERAFRAAVKEKASASHGYQRTAGNVEVGEGPSGPQGFAAFLPFFRIPLAMPDEQDGTAAGSLAVYAAAPAAKRSTIGYTACDIKPIVMPQLLRFMEDPRYGLGEKVDGQWRFVRYDGSRLTGYNRDGLELPALPEAWMALERLGCAFVTVGEHLPVRDGLYAIFEPLAWGDEDVRDRAYQEKHRALEDAMIAAGLIKGAGTTLRQAVENSLVEGIALLSVSRGPQEAQEVFAQVQAMQAEGVVVRLLDGRYDGPRAVQKWKFYPTVDCVAVGIEREGKVVGSLQMALVRESDGALIEVCTVRSGLSNAEVEALAREIEEVRASQGAPEGERKHYPVLELKFLLPSTPGRKLRQPAVVSRRDDKRPEGCTFGQFLDLFVEGRERRAALIEEATPIEGLSLSSL